MPWVTPIHSRATVNRAGNELLESTDATQLMHAREILSNWRSAHGYPLNALAMTLKNRVRRIARKAIIAQRLKRLVSIENKLLRLPEVRATQIQDIGGARVILPSMREVRLMQELYRTGRSRVFQEQRIDDYIETPKMSGYRSVHLVYRYSSENNPAWRNMRVELQIRSRIQHAWAAGVEAVSFFSGQDLKASEGNPQWLRFFMLMAHWMAHEEQCLGVPALRDVPRGEFLEELVELWNVLEVEVVLAGWGYSLREIKELRAAKDQWNFLLHLDAQKKTIEITSYAKSDDVTAADHYARLEETHSGDPNQHIVLVTVDDLKQLEAAYPSFFADTEGFRASAKRAVAAAMQSS